MTRNKMNDEREEQETEDVVSKRFRPDDRTEMIIKYTFWHCPSQDMPDAILNGDRCENCWFDWLKEEVEEDGNR